MKMSKKVAKLLIRQKVVSIGGHDKDLAADEYDNEMTLLSKEIVALFNERLQKDGIGLLYD